MKRKSAKRTLARIVIALCCAALLWIGYLLWLMGSLTDNPETKGDVGIVLGAALWGDKPSPGLRERLDKAVELYRTGRIPGLIVSGGAGSAQEIGESRLTEAEGMRNYLLEQGIPRDVIWMENQSTDTYENLLFSKSIVQEHHWRKVVIITHQYHAARALDMAEFLGYEHPAAAPVTSKVLMMSWHKSRETLAWTKWTLDKLLLTVEFKG
ncbi:YdcF family protein [Paenibacillus sp. NPDC056579]|uniref:YdcF family protein n=1 Tax=Paenibacillus sp. NPDC056579 TaxID=3345871 RepID=UPI00369E52B0